MLPDSLPHHLRFYLGCVLCIALCACASAPVAINYGTPAKPHAGCFAPKVSDSAGHEGVFLPEIVLAIGLTSEEDGKRVKVLRAPDFNPAKWEPHPKEDIVFGGRCRAGADLQQMFDASRGDGDAAARTRPPNK